ncbi:MAG: VapC toxin family PIN domain ribonuclease [Planctomycetota bacterium]|nr:MAG: VapC toxin family PIN domain ribonuclease [Planctomycetota bacterium]
MWHLDSNIFIAILRGDRRLARIVRSRIEEIAVSAFVVAELRYGARRSAKPDHNLREVERVTSFAPVVPFDNECADTYSGLRLSLERRGRRAGETDMLIASVALTHQATLVTHNIKHFELIDGLQIEDWLSP